MANQVLLNVRKPIGKHRFIADLCPPIINLIGIDTRIASHFLINHKSIEDSL